MNRIRIDPNVRVRGNQTFSQFSDAEDDDLEIGDPVEVYEEESGIHGPARITDLDYVRRLVYLSVKWNELDD